MLDVTSERGGRPPVGPYLTTAETAIYLGISERTLRNWRWSGVGPDYRKHGTLVFYYVADLDRWSRERAGRGPRRGPRRRH